MVNTKQYQCREEGGVHGTLGIVAVWWQAIHHSVVCSLWPMMGLVLIIQSAQSWPAPVLGGLAAQIHRALKKIWVSRICIQLKGNLNHSIG